MSEILKIERVRAAVTKTAKLLARDKVVVRQQGHIPHVQYNPDGTVKYVNLPNIPDKPPEDFLLAIQGFLDHEVAHVLFTKPTLYMPWFERAEREGMPLELMKSFENAFEDVRIEREMTKEFRGSALNLSLSLKFMLERRIKPKLDELRDAGLDDRAFALNCIPICFVAYVRAKSGALEAREFMDREKLWGAFALIEAAFPDLYDRLERLADSGESAALAYEFTRAVTPPPPPPPPPMPACDDCDDPKEGDEGDDDKAPEDADDGDSKESDDKEDEGEGAGGGDDETDSETHDEDEEFDDEADPSDDDSPPFGEDDEPDDEEDPDLDDEADEEDEFNPDEDDDDFGDEEDDDLDEEGDDEDGGSGPSKRNLTLTAAMKKLDPDQRRALFLYNNKRKTLRAVAETMKVSENKVSDLMKSGRRRLKELMGK